MFTKHREMIRKFKETGDFKNPCRNKLDKTWFDHDSAYDESKNFGKRTVSGKVLKDRAYELL